jgi:hypothetical protein
VDGDLFVAVNGLGPISVDGDGFVLGDFFGAIAA